MNRSAYILLFIIVISFQSCFEIVEQLAVKSDGSGSFRLVLNLSQSKGKINTMLRLGLINEHKIPTRDEVRQKVAEIESVAGKTAGISAVKTNLDFNNYIASVSLNFMKVAHLNLVINNIDNKENANGNSVEKYFEYNSATATFTRNSMPALKELYAKMSTADRAVFSGAGFTAIYRFETPVESRTNKRSAVSPAKTAVMLKLPVTEIINKTTAIENKIKTAKP